MIRPSPLPVAAPLPPRVPTWALPYGLLNHDAAAAAFYAGAALTALDTLVRSEPEWAGAWRQRLALKCAAAATKRAGRSEDEAALRDAWHWHDAGPAGALFHTGLTGEDESDDEDEPKAGVIEEDMP